MFPFPQMSWFDDSFGSIGLVIEVPHFLKIRGQALSGEGFMMSKSYKFFRSKKSLAREWVDPSPDEVKFYEANAYPTELTGPAYLLLCFLNHKKLTSTYTFGMNPNKQSTVKRLGKHFSERMWNQKVEPLKHFKLPEIVNHLNSLNVISSLRNCLSILIILLQS